MVRIKRLIGLTAALLILSSVAVFAEEDGGFGFGLDLGLGAETFNEIGETDPITWQMLSLNPDIAIGPFGIGLDVTLHYRFTGGIAGNEFEVRTADWAPAQAGKTFFELYLPIFRYIRWGLKGDPLFVKLGSVDDASLGNGFIMGNYANTSFLPETRIFGLAFDLDGRLFNFPYVGFQSFIGNLAHPDVIAGRLFVRPFIWMSIPIIRTIEFGGTLAMDIDPSYYLADKDLDNDTIEGNEQVSIFGVDVKIPILTNKLISLVAFGDIVSQTNNVLLETSKIDETVKNGKLGGMVGFGGKLFSFLPYGFQLRILGSNFIPAYFGATYDMYRGSYYKVITSTDEIIPATAGWYASTGLSILDDMISLHISLEGPFQPGDAVVGGDVVNPHLRGVFTLAEGLLPGIYLNASYDKYIDSFADLIDPTDAVIGASINYQTGPAVITLEYDVRYNPTTTEFETTAQLKTSISLF